MREIVIETKDEGQRLDKFLKKFFCNASGSFLYKMLRKKNIVLNGKKAEGNELLKNQDVIGVFFSEETFAKFSSISEKENDEFTKAYEMLKGIQVLWETEDVLVLDKPSGILSQKDKPEGYSLNEWIVGYLIKSGKRPDLKVYRPSVLNRIDRNTSGIVLAAKTYQGSRVITAMIKDRSIRKFYLAVVEGIPEPEGDLRGYLYKDNQSNKVEVFKEKEKIPKEKLSSCNDIRTKYRRIATGKSENREYALLEVELITGKSHQIRAHMASIGFPLAGDKKYGGNCFRGKSTQFLHAHRIAFPKLQEDILGISEKEIISSMPKGFWLTENCK